MQAPSPPPEDPAPRHAGEDPRTAEAGLSLSPAQLQGVLDAANQGILTIDESRRIVMANPAAAAMFGVPQGLLIGSPLSRWVPQQFRPAHEDHVTRFIGTGIGSCPGGLARSVVGLRGDGTEFAVDASVSLAVVGGRRLCTAMLRPVDALQRGDEALRSSRELTAAVFAARHVGMVKIDRGSRRFLAVNAAFCRLSGHDETALLSMTVDALSHPDGEPGSRPLADLLDDVPLDPVEQRLLHRDGHEVWVLVDGGPVRDGAAGAAAVLAIVQDVTARRLAEAELHARDARHAFLLRLNDRLRHLSEPREVVEVATRMLCRFCRASRVGYAEDDGNGATVTLLHNHVRGVASIEGRYRYEDYGAALLEALRLGETVVRPDIANDPALTTEERQAHAVLGTGATVNVPLRGAGQLIAVFFVHASAARDWTREEVALFEDVAERVRVDLERARAQALLRKAKAEVEAALESMLDAVCITDRQGDILGFNQAFVSFHRFASKAEVPRTLEGLVRTIEMLDEGGLPVPLAQWAVTRALRGEVASNVEFWLRRRDSGERWVASCSFAPIRDDHGEVAGTVLTCRDITPIRAMQTELRVAHAELQQLVDARDRAQEAERLRIAGELHDELQQGLASIVIEAGAAAAAPMLDPSTQGSLCLIAQVAEEAIDATRRIIRDLRPQTLEDLGLATALELLARQFTQRTRIPCALDVTALGPTAAPDHFGPQGTILYRIAQEALNNVAKHAGAHSVLISLSGGNGHPLCLAVTDDGRGWVTDTPRPPDAYGLLGIRERVRAVGGRLTIESSPGRGTRLRIEMPLPAAPEAGSGPPAH
jgi:PAS domain S-box-containing protein